MRVIAAREVFLLDLGQAEHEVVRGLGWGWHSQKRCDVDCTACQLVVPYSKWWTRDERMVAALRDRCAVRGAVFECYDRDLLAQLAAMDSAATARAPAPVPALLEDPREEVLVLDEGKRMPQGRGCGCIPYAFGEG